MNVTLIDYTGCNTPDPARHAANVLVFTKNTRLNMVPGLLEEIRSWPEEKILKELSYMARTVPSSWEFVSYSFLIGNVTRAFTHQLVRTRTGSYAQQAMRVVDVTGWTYSSGPTVEAPEEVIDLDDEKQSDRSQIYDGAMKGIADAYDALLKKGAKVEDARGILPTNIHTNIVAKFSLRCVSDLVRKRSSSRVQDEYRAVLDGMVKQVLEVHPWAGMFINRSFDVAARELDAMISDNVEDENTRIAMVKLIDQMRASS